MVYSIVLKKKSDKYTSYEERKTNETQHSVVENNNFMQANYLVK